MFHLLKKFSFDIIVRKKTKELIIYIFSSLLAFVIECQRKIIDKPKEEFKESAHLARSIYILGVLCKYFDVEKPEYDDLEVKFFIYYILSF